MWCFQKPINDLWPVVKSAFGFENPTLISQKLWELVLCTTKAFYNIWSMTKTLRRSSLSDWFFSGDSVWIKGNRENEELSLQSYTIWYTVDIRFIYIDSLLRINLFWMTEVYNAYICVLMYTEHRISLFHVLFSAYS